jgi:hypothetical protein
MSAENKKPPFPMDTYAFPSITPDGDVTWISPGMTLRDWFAGQALAGLAANCDDSGMSSWCAQPLAARAYEIADAMLEARK